MLVLDDRPMLDIWLDACGTAGIDEVLGSSNDQIDRAVTQALDAGASGAKLVRAGGGGFMLAICPVERRRAVRESLTDIRELPIRPTASALVSYSICHAISGG